MKRSTALRPLAAEHHQALLVAFQLKKGLAGHAETAGAPKDLPGLLALARRFARNVLEPHLLAEEALLTPHLEPAEGRRLADEHAELRALVTQAARAREADQRTHLGAFADLLERHVRWEERELFVALESRLAGPSLDAVGAGLERRLVLNGQGGKKAAT